MGFTLQMLEVLSASCARRVTFAFQAKQRLVHVQRGDTVLPSRVHLSPVAHLARIPVFLAFLINPNALSARAEESALSTVCYLLGVLAPVGISALEVRSTRLAMSEIWGAFRADLQRTRSAEAAAPRATIAQLVQLIQ